MTSPAIDRAARRAVWEALSTLFLDSDVAVSREHRAAVLAASPYQIDEIEAILAREVSPVLVWNLMSPAGEWAGFDLDELERRIDELTGRSAFVGRALGRLMVLRSDEWSGTRDAIAAARARADLSSATRSAAPGRSDR